MAITKTRLGTNEDGTPLFHFHAPDGHVVVTGPATGDVTLEDGTTYNVSDAVVEVSSPEHAAEVAHLIGNSYVFDGHPTDATFIYTPPTDGLADSAIKMALASVTAENAALAGLSGTGATNQMPFVSLHSATPGTNGANENAATGSYARQSCSWNTPSGGAMTNSTALTFSTLGSVAVTHIGTWSLVSAGVYAIGAALGSSVTAATITIAAGAISFSAS